MTTITIYTRDELKVVLQHNLDDPEDLSYETLERTYHRAVPVGLPVGRKDWTVSCVSNLPSTETLRAEV